LLFAFIFGWKRPVRTEASLADYRDEMVSFVKVEPNLEMKSAQLGELIAWLGKAHAPSELVIPRKVQGMEPAGCRALRFHGHDVTLVCFHRANGGLLHLFVMDRAAFPRLPRRERAEFSSQSEWATAAWSDGENVYLMAAQGDRSLLESLLSDI
jgi:hypothetical protein